jgi:hypothetical protein
MGAKILERGCNPPQACRQAQTCRPAHKEARALNGRAVRDRPYRSAALAAAKKSSSAIVSLPVGFGNAPQTTITTCSRGFT